MSSKPPKIIHPFFISIFPILSLYACNLGEIVLSRLIAPLAVVLIACAILWQLLSRLITNKYRAGIILTGFWFYFFAYGHYRRLIDRLNIEISHTLPSWPYIAVWTLIFVAGIYFVYRVRIGMENITRILNVMVVTVFVISAANIVLFEVKAAKRFGTILIDKNTDVPISARSRQRPNVFYIILDQHARGDVLREYYDYDNDHFYQQLKEQGFWVAQNSYTNYFPTQLSLASSLNFHYLGDVVDGLESRDFNGELIREILKDNKAIRLFRKLGYSIVSFSSEFSYSEFRSADVYIRKENCVPLNDFTAELISNTVIRDLTNKALGGRLLTYHSHRRHILNTLDRLPEVMQTDKPVFVFAHIVCPHQPYVFDSQGNAAIPNEIFTWATRSINVSKMQRASKYLAQLEYLDRRIVEVVKKIKQNSPSPPVIVIQSDHGVRWTPGRGEKPGISEKKPYAAILNLYHLPGFDYTKMHDSISPVNTFRVIFNHYFGMNYELLEDKSFLSSSRNPYHFTDITEELSSASTLADPR